MAFSAPVRETDLSSGVCILAPPAEPYRAAADRLKAALEAATSTRVEVLPDGETGFRGRHVVALGNMMDSAFLRTLYLRAYDLTDRAWPGPGGWAIRTIPYSLPGVGHVIAAGVSEAKDAGAAAEALSGALSGPVLPYQHRVNLGRWADLFANPARERIEKGDAELEREFTAGPGDWTYMWAIAEIGVLAVQTGNADLARMFCRQVRHFCRTRWFERHLPDPPQIHGFLRTMLLPFTILEHHPGLPREEREETLEAFLGIYRSTEGGGNPGFLRYVGLDQVRQNHQTMSGLDLFYGGRYFHQAHGLAEGLAWVKLAEIFFAPQMASNKPVCDSWGHQWAFSLFNTADFALASGRTDYVASRPFLEAADRALIAHSHLEGGPLQYFLMASAVTGNDEYLQLCRVQDEDALVRRALRPNVEPLRTWVTGRPAAVPERLGRAGAAPLSRLFHDSLEEWGSFAPKGVYRRDVPFEKTFDKIYFRSGWTEDDDYLLLCGISGGPHSYQDGNCIVRYTSRGKNWFGGRIGLGVASVREHVGVSVAADGAGPGSEARYASLRYLKEGKRFSAAGTEMDCPGQATWSRHVVHDREGWFLVIDEVRASRKGEFLVEGRWHVLGETSLSDGVLRSVQGDARLTMKHAGSGSQRLEPAVSMSARGGTRWIHRSLTPLNRGRGVRFATLFWADRGKGSRSYDLAETDSGYRVTGEGRRVTVLLEKVRKSVEVAGSRISLPASARGADASDASPFRIPEGGLKPVWRGACEAPVKAIGVWREGCYAGDEGGGVRAVDRSGKTLWAVRLPGAIRAVAALENGVAAGGDAQRIHRLDLAGKEVWAHQLHWQPMNWDYWTLKNCIVLSLATGDIDSDGRTEVLAGCADRHIYAFDDAGNLRWRSACQWGPPSCLITARLEEASSLQVLAGLSDPSIHGWVRVYGADGAFLRALQRPDLTCWGIPSWMKCLRVADLDGDGWAEVVSGVDTNHRQLIVYRRNGQISWDADLGAAVQAIEAAGDRVFAGAVNGFAQCFRADGTRLWSRFLAEPVVGLAPSPDGECLVALGNGTVVRLGDSGEIRDSGGGSSEILAAVRAGHSGGLLVGRKSGELESYE